MKNKKVISILGSAILIASVGIAGCSIQASAETTKETEEETTTTATTTADEDPCCGCIADPDDEEYYSCPAFQSTNGELEGQSEYMTLCPDWNAVDWDQYPDYEDNILSDLSVFEDEDVRNAAQSCMDDGYSIHDPEIDQLYCAAVGDGEYQFCNGFTAYRELDGLEEYISAYKMNETLFDYFLVDYLCMEDTEMTDDGTVIRYGEGDYYIEFNRDTGIGLVYSSWDMAVGVGL